MLIQPKSKTGKTPCFVIIFFYYFFFSLNTFYFYYKYSSVVTKRSICHEGTAKHKECSAHKTVFVHNMWSGMLILAGSEKGETPTMNLSSLHCWKNRERGSRVKAIGWCLWRDTSDRFTQTPVVWIPPFTLPVIAPYEVTSHVSLRFSSPHFSGAL